MFRLVMLLLILTISIAAMLAVVFLLWVWPISLGIREARKKNYSPAWMWFGVHPLGGWIMFSILRSLRPKVQCRSCGALVKDNFIRCPVCHGAVSLEAGPLGSA